MTNLIERVGARHIIQVLQDIDSRHADEYSSFEAIQLTDALSTCWYISLTSQTLSP